MDRSSPRSGHNRLVVDEGSPTGFFDLPPEIRLDIYEFALSDLTSTSPKKPSHGDWFPPGSRSRFATLEALLCSTDQVSAEVESLFSKKYSHCERFDFYDVASLYEFYRYAIERPFLRNVHFSLQSTHLPSHYYFGSTDDDGVHLTSCSAALGTFLELQPGLESNVWKGFDGISELIDAAVEDAIHHTLPPDFWLVNGQHPHCQRVPQDFWLFTRQHSQSYADSEQTAIHRTLYVPLSNHGLRLSFYKCLAEPRQDGRHYGTRYHRSMMELSGCIADVQFEGLDDQTKQRSMDCGRCSSPWGYQEWQDPHDYGGHYHYEGWQSPDIDEDKWREMDADSWGVPDDERLFSEDECENDTDRYNRLVYEDRHIDSDDPGSDYAEVDPKRLCGRRHCENPIHYDED